MTLVFDLDETLVRYVPPPSPSWVASPAAAAVVAEHERLLLPVVSDGRILATSAKLGESLPRCRPASDVLRSKWAAEPVHKDPPHGIDCLRLPIRGFTSAHQLPSATATENVTPEISRSVEETQIVTPCETVSVASTDSSFLAILASPPPRPGHDRNLLVRRRLPDKRASVASRAAAAPPAVDAGCVDGVFALRPGLFDLLTFLARARDVFELVLWTHGHSEYASPAFERLFAPIFDHVIYGDSTPLKAKQLSHSSATNTAMPPRTVQMPIIDGSAPSSRRSDGFKPLDCLRLSTLAASVATASNNGPRLFRGALSVKRHPAASPSRSCLPRPVLLIENSASSVHPTDKSRAIIVPDFDSSLPQDDPTLRRVTSFLSHLRDKLLQGGDTLTPNRGDHRRVLEWEGWQPWLLRTPSGYFFLR